MSGEPDPRYIVARRVLLDALDALERHRDSIVLIGAQAVYHWAHEAELHVAPFTLDADLALDPRRLKSEPPLDRVLIEAGFVRGASLGQWIGSDDVTVDLLVPSTLAPAGRRTARIPPHADGAARKANGIEGCVVDASSETIGALEKTDHRVIEVRIAGPAALIVAKLIKLDERIAGPERRVSAKDALDIYRILVSRRTDDLVERFADLLTSEVSRPAAERAITLLRRLFFDAAAQGPSLVALAIGAAGQPELERVRCVSLARQLHARLIDNP